MERRTILISLGLAGALAAGAWLALRPTGLRVGALRVVPPAPGECVGRFEATVVNGTAEAIRYGALHVVWDDEDRRSQDYSIFPMGEEGPVFATFPADAPVFVRGDTLEPGASCTLIRRMVRVRSGGAAPAPIHGEVYTKREGGKPVILNTLPVDIDPAAWPLPVPIGAGTLDRALREGHELCIAIGVDHLPHAGGFRLEVGPGGRVRGRGWGGLPGRTDGERDFATSGTLTGKRMEALLAAARVAPFAAFQADPRNRYVEDGRPVRLLVAAGPAAFAGYSQEEDFEKAGLAPLIEHLLLLLRDLPEVEREN